MLFNYEEHPWLLNSNAAPNIPLGEAVRARLKQFSAMNKFKKKALKVSFLPASLKNLCICFDYLSLL